MHEARIQPICHLTDVLMMQGKLDEAADQYRKILVMCQGVLGKRHLTKMHIMLRLGELLRLQGKFEEAESSSSAVYRSGGENTYPDNWLQERSFRRTYRSREVPRSSRVIPGVSVKITGAGAYSGR